MANERKEPTLSTSSLSDNRSSKSDKPVQKGRHTGATGTVKSPVSPKLSQRPIASQTPSNKSNSGMVFFVFLLSLIALGIAAYNVWQLQQANNIILDQQTRIVELEKKLTVAGDTSSQSITSLAANFAAINGDVKLSLTEIDKLWATRNVNKNAISDNAEKLTAIEQQAKSINSGLTATDKKIITLESTAKTLGETIQSQVKIMSNKLEELTKQSQSQTVQLASIDEKAKAIEKSNTELEKLAQSLKTQTAQQEITLQSLRERVAADLSNTNAQPSTATAEKINQLAAQVRENQEAVRAIDAFRITVNRELLLLKQRAPAVQ